MAASSVITDPSLLEVLAAATEARNQCLELLSLLDHQQQNQGSTPATAAASDAERKLKARLALLRGLNRRAVLSVRGTKAETTEARQEVDGLHLQLQNLYYEQRHLIGEIRAAGEFEHKYMRLPMVPVEDFLAAHPEFDGVNEHELTLARIRDEHEARKALEAQRQELVKRKEELVRETTAKKDELNRFDADVEKWLAGQESLTNTLEAREKKAEAAAAAAAAESKEQEEEGNEKAHQAKGGD